MLRSGLFHGCPVGPFPPFRSETSSLYTNHYVGRGLAWLIHYVRHILKIDLHKLEYVKIVKCYAHHTHHMVTHCSEMSYYTMIYASMAGPTQSHCITSQSSLTTTSYPSSVIGHWKVYWHLHNMFSDLINLLIRMVTGVYGSLPYLIRLYLPSPKTLYHFAKWFMSKTPYLPIISRTL